MKLSIKSTNKNVILVSIYELFNLLNIFAKEKNPNAAIIYKILVFFLIEKHD